ncbi:MAG TPA: transglycosylase SLT domain-containing protein [Bryobacteraceae bacterium]|jgi:membrane-bound lytic murein transglycosylase D|nr:transglycosylase SLT domain-containing protein [Bryobacteraceae bacterium]
MTRLYLILSGAILLATFSGAAGAATPSPEDLSSAPSTSAIDAANEFVIPDSSSAADFSTPHSKEADDRLARSDSHLNAGRQLYFKGDLTGARREFDAAVDALLGASESLPDYRRVERRLDQICDLIYRFDVEKLGAGKNQDDTVAFDKAPIDEISHTTFPVDPKLAPKLESELTQTSSGIPLDLTDPVLSYVHFFSTDRGRSILLAGLRRSGRYQALIQRIFAEEGVPQDLIYLAQAESGFLPRAISYKKAVGMWQFIAGTGATYDLVHTSTFDERFDPEKATRAAAKYLKDLYARYGDWYLAMAAYNCGAGAVDRAIERTGYADYWELLKRHALPRETASYVPIIVAMTIMEKNPKDYGLENIDLDPPVEYDTIQLTANTNLNLIADATMQPVSVIRDLNPALLKTIAPCGFTVHVPKGSGQAAQLALATVPAENRQAWRLHHVEAGDTLAAIAKSYHLAPERIIEVNRGADSLETGDVLLIPAVYHQERPAYVRAHSSRTKVRSTSRTQTHSKTPVRQASHISASRHVSSQILHRKAAVRTASLTR